MYYKRKRIKVFVNFEKKNTVITFATEGGVYMNKLLSEGYVFQGYVDGFDLSGAKKPFENPGKLNIE